jgi:uncharacterized membrane protein
MRLLLGIGLTLAGINHFADSDFYVQIVPPYMSWPLELVYVSGAIELALGALILIPRYSMFAAWGIIALFVAVFPANVHMAVNSQLYPAFSPVALWIRLPLQGVLIAWAYWFTRPNDHPLRPKTSVR